MLILDETGFLKKGDQSVGVPRPYSGTAGRMENGQSGVFLAYHTARGRTFLDRALYLPKSWTDEADRCAAAGVPDPVRFATQPKLGQALLRRALDAGVPARWVTGDSVYGGDSALRRFWEGRQMAYVLGVTSDDPVRPYTAGYLADTLPKTAWHRVSAGAGSKGPRWFDWALYPIGAPRQGWSHWLLLRRHRDKPQEQAYFRVFAPTGTSLETMVAVAGKRWAVEECFALAKGECGLDEYEVRSWVGWHRHVTLSLLAHAYLTVVRAQAQATAPTPPKKRVGADYRKSQRS